MHNLGFYENEKKTRVENKHARGSPKGKGYMDATILFIYQYLYCTLIQNPAPILWINTKHLYFLYFNCKVDKVIIVFMQLNKFECFACIGSVNKVFTNLPYDISAVARGLVVQHFSDTIRCPAKETKYLKNIYNMVASTRWHGAR